MSSQLITIRTIRGAIQVDADTPTAVLDVTRELITSPIERNGLHQDDIVSILFPATPDLISQFLRPPRGKQQG